MLVIGKMVKKKKGVRIRDFVFRAVMVCDTLTFYVFFLIFHGTVSAAINHMGIDEQKI